MYRIFYVNFSLFSIFRLRYVCNQYVLHAIESVCVACVYGILCKCSEYTLCALCMHIYFPDHHHHHFKERVSNRLYSIITNLRGIGGICMYVCVSTMLSGVCIIVKAVSRHVICVVCACIAFRCQIILACQSIKESGIFWMTHHFTR